MVMLRPFYCNDWLYARIAPAVLVLASPLKLWYKTDQDLTGSQ